MLMKRLFSILILLMVLSISLRCYGQYYEIISDGASITITGTSSLHDWKMEVKSFKSGFRFNKEGLTGSFDNVTFNCNVSSIRSESSLMDRKAYSALKAEVFPEIKFEGVSMTDLVFENNRFSGNLNGRLYVSGETKTVTIPFSGSVEGNSLIRINAKADLSLSSFKITPPTAMLGTLKTGDRISVLFSLQYAQPSQAILMENISK